MQLFLLIVLYNATALIKCAGGCHEWTAVSYKVPPLDERLKLFDSPIGHCCSSSLMGMMIEEIIGQREGMVYSFAVCVYSSFCASSLEISISLH